MDIGQNAVTSYLNGEGTAVNYEESLKWFKEAKKNGYNDIEDYIPIDSLIEEINSLILRLNENERETSDD